MAGQTPASRRSFWLLWAAATVGVSVIQLVAPAVLFAHGLVFVVPALLAVVVMAIWMVGERVKIGPVLLAPLGGLLSFAAFFIADNVLYRASGLDLSSAPRQIDFVVNWYSYLLYGPVLIALGVGSAVALYRLRRADAPRRFARVALATMGIAYAAGVTFLWLRVGLAPWGRTEAARFYASRVYPWATMYPIVGLGIAATVALWYGVARRRQPGIGA